MQETIVTASKALEMLKDGNKAYINSNNSQGDVSLERRLYTSENGQKPYAVIVGCSDSRVIPESIFSAGIGDLFVVRVAGNVIDNHQLGSIEYAVEHLGCRLVMVMGHTQCGAVGAATHKNKGFVSFITDEIKRAIGEETNPIKASILNVKHSVAKIQKLLKPSLDLQIVGAIYYTDSGVVDFEI